MSAEENKERFRNFMEEVANRGNMAALDEFVASDFVEREELPPGAPPGRDAVEYFFTMVRTGFPDLQVTLDDVIAEGDKVVARTTWRGAHRGEFMGIPPTGKTVAFTAIDIVRYAGGKMVEHWGQIDNLGLLQQLGVVPPAS